MLCGERLVYLSAPANWTCIWPIWGSCICIQKWFVYRGLGLIFVTKLEVAGSVPNFCSFFWHPPTPPPPAEVSCHIYGNLLNDIIVEELPGSWEPSLVALNKQIAQISAEIGLPASKRIPKLIKSDIQTPKGYQALQRKQEGQTQAGIVPGCREILQYM